MKPLRWLRQSAVLASALTTGLAILGAPPAAGTPVDQVRPESLADAQIEFPEVRLAPGETLLADWAVRTPAAISPAHIYLSLGISQVKAFIDITVQGGDCEFSEDFLSCTGEQDLPAGVTTIATLRLHAHQLTQGRAGHLDTLGSVNGRSMPSLRGFGKVLIPGGAHDIKALPLDVFVGEATTTQIKVGVTNAGNNPWTNPEPRHPVLAYLEVPGNTLGLSADLACAGRGHPDYWAWLDPGRSSDRYACLGGFLNPGETHWFHINLKVNHGGPASPGTITAGRDVAGDANPANDLAQIRVRTESLPVTGQRGWLWAAAGAGLILLGTAGLTLGSRRRRSRRSSVQSPAATDGVRR